MQADTEFLSQHNVTVDQHFCFDSTAMIDGSTDQTAATWHRNIREAQLHSSDAGSKRTNQTIEPLYVALSGLRRDQVAVRLQQGSDHWPIGGRHGIGGELGGRHPNKGLPLIPARLAAPAFDTADIQAQSLLRVALRYGDDGIADFDLDAEFFVEFANQSLLGCFAGLAFAAWEFPQSSQVATFGAAREQDAAGGVGDDACDDVDER